MKCQRSVSHNFQAQEYNPLAVDEAHWIVAVKDYYNHWVYENLWEYYGGGDTIVEGEEYLKVYRQQLESIDSGSYQPPFYSFGPQYLHGLIRDDTVEKKAYAISFLKLIETYDDCPLNEEYLLYDFSLYSGEVINFCLGLNYQNVYDKYRGTVFNLETTLFRLSEFDFLFFWEGIGSTLGLFETFWEAHDREDISYLYYYCRNDSCDLLLSTKSSNNNIFTIKISPNPAKDIFHIQSSSYTQQEYMIEVIDLFGIKIKEAKLPKGQNEIELNVQGWNKGLYLVWVRSGGKIIAEQKLIVQ